jgi:hypothetical protein
MAKRGGTIRVSDKNIRNDVFFIFHSLENLKDEGLFDAMLFTLRESRRTPDPVLPMDRSRFTTASPLAPWL